MAEGSPEQRATRRFSLRLPVTIKFTNGQLAEAQAQTRDVSARGVFFFMDSKIEEGSTIEFTLTLPPEITLTESIRVRCRGKVVRVDQGAGAKVGIGAVIEQYDFVSEV
jgi:hypothetical protein